MRNKRSFTDEELLTYLKVGWHFHLKKVSKYEYIVRRKGQVTRSLGRYSDELWNRIQNLDHKLTLELEGLLEEQSQTTDEPTRKMRRKAHRSFVKAREHIITRTTYWRGTIKSLDCRYITDDYCTHWLWEERMPFFSSIQDTKLPGTEYLRENKDKSGIKSWTVRAEPFYCSTCHAYEPIEKRESYPILSVIEQHMKQRQNAREAAMDRNKPFRNLS
jgi:ElaB/YqjD/DUF883 family membrane-anchored ribosome-binding protein